MHTYGVGGLIQETGGCDSKVRALHPEGTEPGQMKERNDRGSSQRCQGRSARMSAETNSEKTSQMINPRLNSDSTQGVKTWQRAVRGPAGHTRYIVQQTPVKNCDIGLERWLSGWEHRVLFQRS